MSPTTNRAMFGVGIAAIVVWTLAVLGIVWTLTVLGPLTDDEDTPPPAPTPTCAVYPAGESVGLTFDPDATLDVSQVRDLRGWGE